MDMNQPFPTQRYAKCVEVSKRVRWDIEADVFRGRPLDVSRPFLPDGLSRVSRLDFLDESSRRLISQIQGRTYANMFGLVERFIGAKILEVSRNHWLGDQIALEALVRFSDEELKHQEMFRRLDAMMAQGMPAGYQFMPQPNEVAQAVLASSTWAVLALTCHIELFTQAHYHASIEPDVDICPLWKDVFLHHWREESQHAILDELEWLREDAALDATARNAAVDHLIGLVAAVDGIVVQQAGADTQYFLTHCAQPLTSAQQDRIENTICSAYRNQYIASGVQDPRFQKVLGSMITAEQAGRINAALAPILEAAT